MHSPEWYFEHSKLRAWARFGLELTPDSYASLQESIERQQARFVRQIEDAEIWFVQHGRHQLPVVYKRGLIATVLPATDIRLQEAA